MVTLRKIVTMKKCIISPLFVILILFSQSLFSQHIKVDTLIDKTTGNKYFIDEHRNHIVSTNERRVVLWKTNPISDAIEILIFGKMEILTINSFSFEHDRNVTQKEALLITYSDNSHYYLDKISGKVIWCWRD